MPATTGAETELSEISLRPKLAAAASTNPAVSPIEKFEAESRDPDDMTWYSIDGGGSTSSNSGLSLTGAVGQPEPGLSAGDTVAPTGGVRASTQTLHMFSDGLESGGELQ